MRFHVMLKNSLLWNGIGKVNGTTYYEDKKELQSGREKIYEYWNRKNNVRIQLPKKDWMEIPYFPDEESQMRFLYLVELCGLDNFEAWFEAILLLEDMDSIAAACFKGIRKQEGKLALAAIAGWICSTQNVYAYLTSHSILMRFFMEKRTGTLRRRVIDFVLGGEWESAALEDKLCFYYPYQSLEVYIGKNPLQQSSTEEVVFLCGEVGIGKMSAVLQYESARNNVVASIHIGSIQCMEEVDWLLFELIIHQAVPCINVQGVLQEITDSVGNKNVSFKNFCTEVCHMSGRLYLLAEEGGASAQVCRERLGLESFQEITIEKPVKEQAQELWSFYTNKYGVKEKECLAALVSGFSFTPLQIRRAAQWAGEHRAYYDSEREALYAACDAQLCHNLGKWARKLVCRARWEDLVLPPASKQLLREICDQVRYRDYVYRSWGLGEKFSYGRSMTALFIGSPGTGKTMAAELLDHELGVPLYKIDLPCVVSKYIGETEKNLKEIFAEGKKAQGILSFDEADVLFSKRTEIRDANDKFNNMETAYLLQRLEEYDGIVLLATNYQQNIDEAVKHRLREKPSKHEELTNYRLSQKQEKEGNTPLEAMQIEGKNGILSVGIRKDGTVSAVFSSDKVGMLREDRESIGAEHTKRMGGGGRVYTNSHDEKKSALLYEQSIDKPGHFLMTRCMQYLAARENDAVQDSVPFLAAKSAAERAKWRQEEDFLYQKLDAGREKLQLLLKKLRSGDGPRVDMAASGLEPEEETAIVSGHEDGKAGVR